MSIKTISKNTCFGGTQEVYQHTSQVLKCDMRFSIYIPPQARTGPCPVLIWLSGLTCTEENFIIKAGSQQFASQYGFVVVAPDTSPRGPDIPDDQAYDFGQGAGFYLNAIKDPWVTNYQMYSYITDELAELVLKSFPTRSDCQGIFGHSMGGHGALTIALRNPKKYQSVSAFSPIVAPSRAPWGRKAFNGYLGDDPESWKVWDATELIKNGDTHPGTILIDQGSSDEFLDDQLKPKLFQNACDVAQQSLKFRLHDGYDHSYFFISSFMRDHFSHHASELSI